MTFPQGLLDAFETATTSIFRLETLQHYAGDPNYARWQAGEVWQDTESKAHWCDLVRRRTAEGVAMQRVHVVTEPLADYVRFELEWSYPPNVEAGEDVRVMPGEPPVPQLGDFWLFDDHEVWWMAYSGAGELTEVRRDGIHASLRHWRDAKRDALRQSIPLTEFMASA